MNAKFYISILLSLVFITKMATFDAKLWQFFSKTEKIALVNPFCKKQASSEENSSLTLMYEENIPQEAFQVATVCTTVFFSGFSQEKTAPNFYMNIEHNFALFQNLPQIFHDKILPPPKPIV